MHNAEKKISLYERIRHKKKKQHLQFEGLLKLRSRGGRCGSMNVAGCVVVGGLKRTKV